MSCGACARAIIGLSAEPRLACRGCSARGIAYSSIMDRAMNKALTQDERLAAGVELREAISRALPHVGYDDAREAVLSWWRVRSAK